MWLCGSEETCQPCNAFKPSEVGEAAYYGRPTPHSCPECGGVRYFCGNCATDHHENGWESCSIWTIIRHKCLHKACVKKAYEHLEKAMAPFTPERVAARKALHVLPKFDCEDE